MLVLLEILIRLLSLLAISMSLHLVAAVLLKDLEATTEALALLFNEDSLLRILFLVRGLGRHLLRLVRLLVAVLLVVNWHCRLTRQV